MGHHGVAVDHGTDTVVWIKKLIGMRLMVRVRDNNNLAKSEDIVAESKIWFEVRTECMICNLCNFACRSHSNRHHLSVMHKKDGKGIEKEHVTHGLYALTQVHWVILWDAHVHGLF
jgi:hypothetical protein